MKIDVVPHDLPRELAEQSGSLLKLKDDIMEFGTREIEIITSGGNAFE